jgi:hypothetical protein
MPKKQKLKCTFHLSECDAEIDLYEQNKSGYGTAFLNVKLPDGRWIAFKSVENVRIPMYKDTVAEVDYSVVSKESKTEGQ